ncbi:MAG: YncE family protein [Desulfobulbaceae bacterium]|nr:YncE family protein [Desulfobulbaceae bacterium]
MKESCLLYNVVPLLLFLLAIGGLSGCAQQGPAVKRDQSSLSLQDSPGDVKISVFMSLKDQLGPSLMMQVDGLELFAGEAWVPLSLSRREITSREIVTTGQIIVGRGGVPAGRYRKLRLRIKKAALERLGENIFLATDEPFFDFILPADLALRKGDSSSLFLTWDTASSVQNKAMFMPKMNVATQSIPLTTDLAYVACPEINTLYIIRTDKNRVCGSIGISGGPVCLAANVKRNRLYVLSPGDSSIKIIELTSNRQLDQMRIPHIQQATYMAVSPDGDWAYILDEKGDQLLRLDLNSGGLAGSIRLGSRPRFVTYLENENFLAVSTAYSQEVLFLDPDTLSILKTFSTGGSPDGVIVQDGVLYIAEDSTSTVTAYDLNRGGSQYRVNVGRRPRRFVFANNRLYLSNYGSGSVSILRAGQLNVLRELKVGDRPYEMVVYPARQWLYVGEQAGRGISVIDLSSSKVVQTIELGTSVSDLVLVN